MVMDGVVEIEVARDKPLTDVDLENMIDRGLVTRQELDGANENQLLELNSRARDLLSNPELDQARRREKIMTILDLGESHKIPREELMRQAKEYLDFLPDTVAGIVLTGSRTKADRNPSVSSDQDIIFVATPGQSLLDMGDHEEIIKRGEEIFGVPIDGHSMTEIYYNGHVGPKEWPEICQDSIVVFKHPEIEEIFRRNFAEHLANPQTIFESTTAGGF